MKIDNKLNLVVQVDGDEGTMFVHSMPLSRMVWERYFIVLSKTFSSMIAEGMSFISGPRIAALMLRKVAEESGVWEGRDGVANGLMAEVRRLTNVVLPGENGWTTLPYQNALDRKLISDDDASEVDGLIVFFICVSAIQHRKDVPDSLARMAAWGGQTTSLNCTEYAASLPMLTPAETFAETVAVSSVPH